jgi:hypothetical protein
MPTIFRYEDFVFFFYSNEGDPDGPMHIYVRRAGAEAKFWMQPVAVAASAGFESRTLRRLAAVVVARRGAIERAWREHFG